MTSICNLCAYGRAADIVPAKPEYEPPGAENKRASHLSSHGRRRSTNFTLTVRITGDKRNPREMSHRTPFAGEPHPFTYGITTRMELSLKRMETGTLPYRPGKLESKREKKKTRRPKKRTWMRVAQATSSRIILVPKLFASPPLSFLWIAIVKHSCTRANSA